MKIACFSTKKYDQTSFSEAAKDSPHEFIFFEPRLSLESVPLAQGCGGVCIFVNDRVTHEVLKALQTIGVRLIALRCAGFNNVDLKAANELGITVVRVPAYSPYAVAEHAVALMLALNRRIHRAYNRVREENFSLEGLLGFDMHGKTVGIIGTGKIGVVTANILHGFGCHLLAYDVFQNKECLSLGVQYVSLEKLYQQSDIVTLHCPLLPETQHMINTEAIAQMKQGVMLINTGRGALIDTKAVIEGLKSCKIGYLGLDVYEEEESLFFEDQSDKILKDDIFARLLTFNNVIITGHQAFFTKNALENIAHTTLQNISDFEAGTSSGNEVNMVKVPG